MTKRQWVTSLLPFIAACLWAITATAPTDLAWAQGRVCSSADIGAAVDRAGADLRRLNAEAAPRLQARMRQLREARGWSEAEYEEQSMLLTSDPRSAALDKAASELLAKLDTLGTSRGDGPVDCATIDAIDATAVELIATIRAKSAHTLARLDAALGQRTAAPAPAAASPTAPAASPAAPSSAAAPKRPPPASPLPATDPTVAVPSTQAPSPVPSPSVARPKSPPVAGPADSVGSWTSRTEVAPSAAPVSPPAVGVMPEGFIKPDDDLGYSLDEVREASRGFFGTISGGLAGVMEHAFSRFGRPAGYVLGTEGGGAFLAGLRFGDGTLYLRAGGRRKIYWHGPSIGYDIGLAGSKTMFLIYNLDNEADVFARFTGIDGSAYVVGGVGLTLLTNGRVVMAPIRSGLGLRLGANIGFVRFTDRPTWNPF